MIKVLSERLYLILGKDNDLGNKLHSDFIYECGRDKQIELKQRIDALMGDYSDRGLQELAYDTVTRQLIRDLIALKDEPQWLEVILKLLGGLSDLLDREIKEATEVHKPEMVLKEITERLHGIQIYDELDIVDVQEEGVGMVKVNYLSRRYSPEYDGEFKTWRDTQFIFTLNFNKNLFIWDYINIYRLLRGKGMGSGIIRFCERLARDFGFERFSVEYPNRKFWEKMGYQIPDKYKIGESGEQNYTHEGYKEFKNTV